MTAGKLGGLFPGDATEHHNLNQRVGSQTVGAVDADRGAFADCIQPRHPGRAAAIGLDATHGVVGGRANRNRLLGWVHSDIGLGQLADEGQTLFQILGAQVAQIQMHDIAEVGLDGPPFLLFAPEGLREAIPRPQLHVFVLGLADRDFRA